MNTTTGHVLANSTHPLPHGSKALRRTNPHQWLELTLGVKRLADVPDLSRLDDKKPTERKYLTRDELTKKYGSDPAMVKKIEDFASAHNLKVTRDERTAARLGLAGSVADLSAAFGVQLFDFEHASLGKFHARTGLISVPVELKDAVTGVFGFNNHRILQRRRVTRESTASSSGLRKWFWPHELGTIYNFPPVDASKQCIGLLEFGGGVDPNDVDLFFGNKQGLPAPLPTPSIQVIAVDGVSTDPSSDEDSTGEVMLDVDVAGSLSGGAKLAVYFATFDEKGLVDILSAVLLDSVNDPSVLSVSWGWAENQDFNGSVTWSPGAIDHVNESLLAAANLGISVCVSTGDDGSEAQIQDGKAHVNFPATSPSVLAVGGTSMHAKTSAGKTTVLSETVWNDGPGSGTGGGVSDFVPVPSWQQGKVPSSINPGHFAGRAIPDVAANADPATGYRVAFQGKFATVGGTSASAPLWASLIARINATLGARAGNLNATLYATIGPKKVLRDITSGNNDTDGLLEGQFKADEGWDACTGWGTPNGGNLLNALK
jgi:kumamolisin